VESRRAPNEGDPRRRQEMDLEVGSRPAQGETGERANIVVIEVFNQGMAGKDFFVRKSWGGSGRRDAKG